MKILFITGWLILLAGCRPLAAAVVGKIRAASPGIIICAWNYFQRVDTKENRDFVERFKTKYGRNRVTDDPMEAAYVGVKLWAQAVRAAGTTDPSAVWRALGGQTWNAPGGVVEIDAVTQHTSKTVRIGKIRSDGQFEIVWTSPAPVKAEPFPPFRERREWEEFLAGLYNGWGQQWASPSKRKEIK